MLTKFLPSLPPRPGREVARVAVPVSIEFMIILGMEFANQVIVAGLGDTAVGAVGFANSIFLVPLFVFGALGVSSSILAARAFGAKRVRELNTVVSVALLAGLVVTIPLSLPVVLFPREFFGLVGASDAIAAAGAGYLGVTFAGLAFNTVSIIFGGVLRSVGHPRSPLVSTIVTTSINVPLALAFVFGWGPIPAMGVVGAAWAWLICQTLRAMVLALQTYAVFHVVRWEVPRRLREWRRILSSHLTLAAPIALTSFFWTSGVFVYNVVVSQIGDEALAAFQIMEAMLSIFIVGSLGLSSALTALVGRAVGAGNAAEAAAWAGYIKRIAIVTSVVLGILFAASSLALPFLYPAIPSQVLMMASVGVWLNAALQPAIIRMLMDAALLPSANDVRGILMGDFAGPFLFGLPVSAVLALTTPLGVYAVFIGRVCEDVAKLSIFAWRARRLNWDTVIAKHAHTLPVGDEPVEGLYQAH